MRREISFALILGCLLILLLEAPAAFSSVSEGLEGPYVDASSGSGRRSDPAALRAPRTSRAGPGPATPQGEVD